MNFTLKNDKQISDIPIIKIRPNKAQPRKQFDEDELLSLSQSISENGILQPLAVRRISQTEFELIAGERRLRAAALAGQRTVPCVVLRCTDKESAVFALLENLQRSDLGIFEEARGISRLIHRYGLTQSEAADRLGKKQSTIANKLRLLRLTPEEQEWIVNAGLSERHARALLRITDEETRREVIAKIISDSLNVEQAEQLISMYTSQKKRLKTSPIKVKPVVKDVRIFVNTINKAVNTMKLAGIDAGLIRNDSEDFIEYTIKIPRSKAFESHSA